MTEFRYEKLEGSVGGKLYELRGNNFCLVYSSRAESKQEAIEEYYNYLATKATHEQVDAQIQGEIFSPANWNETFK